MPRQWCRGRPAHALFGSRLARWALAAPLVYAGLRRLQGTGNRSGPLPRHRRADDFGIERTAEHDAHDRLVVYEIDDLHRLAHLPLLLAAHPLTFIATICSRALIACSRSIAAISSAWSGVNPVHITGVPNASTTLPSWCVIP